MIFSNCLVFFKQLYCRSYNAKKIEQLALQFLDALASLRPILESLSVGSLTSMQWGNFEGKKFDGCPI